VEKAHAATEEVEWCYERASDEERRMEATRNKIADGWRTLGDDEMQRAAEFDAVQKERSCSIVLRRSTPHQHQQRQRRRLLLLHADDYQ